MKLLQESKVLPLTPIRKEIYDLGEMASLSRIFLITLIVIGIVGLKMVSTKKA